MERPTGLTKLEILRGDVIDFVRNCHVSYERVYSEKRSYGYRMKFYDLFASRIPLNSFLEHFKNYFPNLKAELSSTRFLSEKNYNDKEALNFYVYLPKELYEED